MDDDDFNVTNQILKRSLNGKQRLAKEEDNNFK